MRTRRVMATLVLVLAMMGCGGGGGGGGNGTEAPVSVTEPPVSVTKPPAVNPPTVLQHEFPQTPFNVETGESPKYQATQVLSGDPQQPATSRRYTMTVSMF